MAESLDVLLDAIKSKWAANKAASGGLQIFKEAQFGEKSTDESLGFPYAIVVFDESRLVLNTPLSQTWRHFITFQLYDRTRDLVGSHASVIRSIFGVGYFDISAHGLTLSEGTLNRVTPAPVTYRRMDKHVWRAEVSYDFETSKARNA